MGGTADDDRNRGMGAVVEYAGRGYSRRSKATVWSAGSGASVGAA
jgi:hypothetical protein